jgi:hypothetical protein
MSLAIRFLFVMQSASSAPVMAPNSIATSFTVLPIGPAVSCVEEIGMIPERLTNQLWF